MTLKKVFSLAILLFFTFCQAVQAYDPKYLEEVVGRKAVAFSDGAELIMVLLQLEDEYPDFASRMEFFQENRFIKKEWGEKGPEAPLRRGELAYILVRMLKLKGGLKARFLGLNQRLAIEELIHQEIMRAGHGADLVTGKELVRIMTRTAQHMISRKEPK